MAHELDLDDAVANVSGDRARRELEELRAHIERLRQSLSAVISVADRKTVEFDEAKQALSDAPFESLAEIKADAVKGAATALMPAPPSPPDDPDPGFNGYCEAIAVVREYSKKIRRGEV